MRVRACSYTIQVDTSIEVIQRTRTVVVHVHGLNFVIVFNIAPPDVDVAKTAKPHPLLHPCFRPPDNIAMERKISKIWTLGKLGR